MAGNQTAVSLKEAGNQTAAAIDEGLEAALDLLGDPLPDTGRGDRVVIKPNTIQRKPGFRTGSCLRPELLPARAIRASARGAEVRIAGRTRVHPELPRESQFHKCAPVAGSAGPPLRIVQVYSARSLRALNAVPDIVTEGDFFSRPLSRPVPEELV
ncbi:hypothetical protein C8250_029585 [Streptomyces sp. So13.3]|uniref:hypothetical protein n=1 Tax=Streptomyces sp. So13.3 TaxID=2136173 RepID=UPI001105DD79|nr:hypothetical protein [Streptomyces sp. So13.3]QNA75486.1 hypothetical protein C8250_029585 [Streptomyces sp. So13.3]